MTILQRLWDKLAIRGQSYVPPAPQPNVWTNIAIPTPNYAAGYTLPSHYQGVTWARVPPAPQQGVTFVNTAVAQAPYQYPAVTSPHETYWLILRGLEEAAHGGDYMLEYDDDANRAMDSRKLPPMYSSALCVINIGWLASFCVCNGADLGAAIDLLEGYGFSVQ